MYINMCVCISMCVYVYICNIMYTCRFVHVKVLFCKSYFYIISPSLQSINMARDALDNELTALVGESYNRAYGVSLW